MDTGRYFLFDVPFGLSEWTIKQSLGELINYPEGVLGVDWIKEATSVDGGIVQLSLDSKAVRLIKTRGEFVYVNASQVTFVDKEELAKKVTSTIDDDVLELVKQEMADEKYKELTKKLKLTKFQHREGYDCWQIEGDFDDIKAFDIGIRKLLFGRTDESSHASSSSVKPKSKRKRKKSRKAAETSGFSKEPMRSGDEQDTSEADLFSVKWFHANVPESDSTAVSMTISRPGSTPLRIELLVGELSVQSEVDAVVVPTDVQLDPAATIFSLTFAGALGNDAYETFRRGKLEELGGFVPSTTCVAMENVDLFARNAILVAEPSEFSEDVSVAVKAIGQCYENVFQMARAHHYATVACPPLGIGKSVKASVAAGSAAAAFMGATRSWSPPLTEYLDVFRFVFSNETDKDIFASIFHMSFDSKRDRGKSAVKKAVAEEKAKTTDRTCSICLATLDSGLPHHRMDECGHVHHSLCIQLRFQEKQNCPDCATPKKGGPR